MLFLCDVYDVVERINYHTEVRVTSFMELPPRKLTGNQTYWLEVLSYLGCDSGALLR